MITATVVEQTFPALRGINRALEIGHDASSVAGFAVFEFPGDAEPGDGNVVVEAAIFQPFGARFLLYVPRKWRRRRKLGLADDLRSRQSGLE